MLNTAWSETHVFSPTAVNEFRVGYHRINTIRIQPFGDTGGINAQFGIPGIPDSPPNGGLTQINITGLSELGGHNNLPLNEINGTLQLTDEPIDAPVKALAAARVAAEIAPERFRVLQPGEVCNDKRLASKVGKPCLHLGIGEARVDLLVELIAGRGAPTAIDPSDARGCRSHPPERTARSDAPAASDSFAPERCARWPGARQRRRPDGENFGGEVSFCTSLSVHITRSPRRRGRAEWAGW